MILKILQCFKLRFYNLYGNRHRTLLKAKVHLLFLHHISITCMSFIIIILRKTSYYEYFQSKCFSKVL